MLVKIEVQPMIFQSWNNLPEDLEQRSYSFLSAKDLCTMSQVSSRSNARASVNRLWQTLFQSKYPEEFTLIVPSPKHQWKKLYLKEILKEFHRKKDHEIQLLREETARVGRLSNIFFSLATCAIPLAIFITVHSEGNRLLNSVDDTYNQSLDQLFKIFPYRNGTEYFEQLDSIINSRSDEYAFIENRSRNNFALPSFIFGVTLIIPLTEYYKQLGRMEQFTYRCMRLFFILGGTLFIAVGTNLNDYPMTRNLSFVQGSYIISKGLLDERRSRRLWGNICFQTHLLGKRIFSCLKRTFGCANRRYIPEE